MDIKAKYGFTFHKEKNEWGRPTVSVLDKQYNINLSFIGMLDVDETECLIESLVWCIDSEINDWIYLSDMVKRGLGIELNYPNIKISNLVNFDRRYYSAAM